jgi:hypothetical protein
MSDKLHEGVLDFIIKKTIGLLAGGEYRKAVKAFKDDPKLSRNLADMAKLQKKFEKRLKDKAKADPDFEKRFAARMQKYK